MMHTDAPVLGVVPWADTLDQPSVLDLEQMFDTTALAGREHLLRRCGLSSSSRETSSEECAKTTRGVCQCSVRCTYYLALLRNTADERVRADARAKGCL